MEPLPHAPRDAREPIEADRRGALRLIDKVERKFPAVHLPSGEVRGA
jgi:hypothetical protein